MSSYSNIADGPSRGDNGEMRRLGYTDVSKHAESCLSSLCMSVKNKLGKMADIELPDKKVNTMQNLG